MLGAQGFEQREREREREIFIVPHLLKHRDSDFAV
jgi:hypothetical protein